MLWHAVLVSLSLPSSQHSVVGFCSSSSSNRSNTSHVSFGGLFRQTSTNSDKKDVALLAAIIMIQESNSFAMQIYQLAGWNSMQEMMNPSDFENERLPLSGTSHITYFSLLITEIYCINVQGLLFLWWAQLLFTSIWNIFPKWQSPKIVISTKILSFLLPMIQVFVIGYEGTRKTKYISSPVLINVIFAASTGLGSLYLIFILIRLLTFKKAAGLARIRLSMQGFDGVKLNVPDDNKSLESPAPSTDPADSNHSDSQWDNESVGHTAIGSGYLLLMRVALAFIITMGLQAYVIWIEFFDSQKWVYFANWVSTGTEPGPYSRGSEMTQMIARIPSALTGLLFFITFGTTADVRAQIRDLFRSCCGGCTAKDRNSRAQFKRKNSETFSPFSTATSNSQIVSRRDIAQDNHEQNTFNSNSDQYSSLSSRSRRPRDSMVDDYISSLPHPPPSQSNPRLPPDRSSFQSRQPPLRPIEEAPVFDLNIFSSPRPIEAVNPPLVPSKTGLLQVSAATSGHNRTRSHSPLPTPALAEMEPGPLTPRRAIQSEAYVGAQWI
jgi:hypothetical protein